MTEGQEGASAEPELAPPGPVDLQACSTPGCPGDGAYAAPGHGHLVTCRHSMWLAMNPKEF